MPLLSQAAVPSDREIKLRAIPGTSSSPKYNYGSLHSTVMITQIMQGD